MQTVHQIRIKQAFAGALLRLCLAGGGLLFAPAAAWAATKPIESVSIRVDSRLEAGGKLPEIGLDGSAEEGGVSVRVSGGRYQITDARWTDSSGNELKVAEEPQMRVTLEPTDVSEYYFPATYKSSSVKISGGSFVSARRDGDDLIVTLRVKGIKGDFGQLENVYWNENRLGEARWEEPDNGSGYYEVQLYRDGKQVYRIGQTSARQYNFYPYMTEAGEYTVRVRSIPVTDAQKKYGDKSDWTESGELTITDRYVSDGKGKNSQESSAKPGKTQQTGWVKEQDGWILRLPDGHLCSQEWYSVNGHWYHFGADGFMQTGWIQDGGRWYYLLPDGQMAVGWNRLGDAWYYFYPYTENGRVHGAMAEPGWQIIEGCYYYFNGDGSMYKGWLNEKDSWYYLNELENSLEGVMLTGWLERNEKTYYLDSNGRMAEGWYEVDGAWRYFYPDSGEMARNTQIDGFPIDGNGIWK